jgi:hypothetical protein
MLIDRYDSDRDGKVSFWEFSNSLLPLDGALRDEIERRKPIWDISYETKDALRSLFRRLLDGEVAIE